MSTPNPESENDDIPVVPIALASEEVEAPLKISDGAILCNSTPFPFSDKEFRLGGYGCGIVENNRLISVLSSENKLKIPEDTKEINIFTTPQIVEENNPYGHTIFDLEQEDKEKLAKFIPVAPSHSSDTGIVIQEDRSTLFTKISTDSFHVHICTRTNCVNIFNGEEKLEGFYVSERANNSFKTPCPENADPLFLKDSVLCISPVIEKSPTAVEPTGTKETSTAETTGKKEEPTAISPSKNVSTEVGAAGAEETPSTGAGSDNAEKNTSTGAGADNTGQQPSVEPAGGPKDKSSSSQPSKPENKSPSPTAASTGKDRKFEVRFPAVDVEKARKEKEANPSAIDVEPNQLYFIDDSPQGCSYTALKFGVFNQDSTKWRTYIPNYDIQQVCNNNNGLSTYHMNLMIPSYFASSSSLAFFHKSFDYQNIKSAIFASPLLQYRINVSSDPKNPVLHLTKLKEVPNVIDLGIHLGEEMWNSFGEENPGAVEAEANWREGDKLEITDSSVLIGKKDSPRKLGPIAAIAAVVVIVLLLVLFFVRRKRSTDKGRTEPLVDKFDREVDRMSEI